MKSLDQRRPTSPRRRAAAALCLALATLAALAAPAPARAETYWVDGYELEITLEPLRPAYILGEPIRLSIRVENRSETELEMLWSGEGGPGWPDDFEVRVFGPDGRELPRPPGEAAAPAAMYDHLRLRAPGDRDRVLPVSGLTVHLDRWGKIERPGLYTVTFRRGLRAGPYRGRFRLYRGTTKPAAEVRLQAQINVVEGGAERVGRLIEELGAKTMECGWRPLEQSQAVASAMRLADLDDERIVPYFVRALGKCKEGSIRSAALRVFEKFQTDAAFEGLRAASADADEDLRTLAALELSKSKHPKARRHLLSLRRDPFYGVRLMVLNALESWDTQEARRLIWEMTNDEHPQVKAEALRFLQERAGHPPRR